MSDVGERGMNEALQSDAVAGFFDLWGTPQWDSWCDASAVIAQMPPEDRKDIWVRSVHTACSFNAHFHPSQNAVAVTTATCIDQWPIPLST